MKIPSWQVLACLVITTVVSSACSQPDSNPSADSAADSTEQYPGIDLADFDPVDLTPGLFRVLLENERVRMLDWNIPAGETDSMHYHPDYAAYFIKGTQVMVLPLDQFSGSFDIPDGTPMYHDGWLHRVKNIGEVDLHAVVVELKDDSGVNAGEIPDGMAATSVNPEVYTWLLEDYRVRILEMKLAAGATTDEHAHTARAVYVLKGGTIKTTYADGQSTELELDAGSVLARDAEQYTVENVGDTDFLAIVFELKTGSEPDYESD